MKFSLNLNKIALLRNARGENNPSLEEQAKTQEKTQEAQTPETKSETSETRPEWLPEKFANARAEKVTFYNSKISMEDKSINFSYFHVLLIFS